MPSPSATLHSLGILLPPPPRAIGSYLPYRRQGDILYLSGTLPVWDGELRATGKLGHSLSLEQGQAAAELCALNLLALIQEAAHSLDHVHSVLQLTGYVNAAEDFYDIPAVINPASALFEKIFGEHGKHTRVAVGVASLPKNAPVEISAIVLLHPPTI
ncbi:MAG: RidA family protein [Methylacidiphilales bacterium]|nr:RidA family protein [Candidatus Methylacidiphilales bacterium]MDW8349774.1 RidA family protein [Verrucomicrobiae bacterium]